MDVPVRSVPKACRWPHSYPTCSVVYSLVAKRDERITSGNSVKSQLSYRLRVFRKAAQTALESGARGCAGDTTLYVSIRRRFGKARVWKQLGLGAPSSCRFNIYKRHLPFSLWLDDADVLYRQSFCWLQWDGVARAFTSVKRGPSPFGPFFPQGKQTLWGGTPFWGYQVCRATTRRIWGCYGWGSRFLVNLNVTSHRTSRTFSLRVRVHIYKLQSTRQTLTVN